MTNKLHYKDLQFTLKEVNEEENSIRAVFSTSEVDRHGEQVDQTTWILEDYLLNPVVLFAHQHNQPVVGRVTSIGINQDGNLEGTVQFAAKEYDFANTLWQLYKNKYMKAFSVGFMPEDVEFKTDESGEEVPVLRNNRLYELSTVPVGAAARALAKQKGIDLTPVEDISGIEKKDEEVRAKKSSEFRDSLPSVCSLCGNETIKSFVYNIEQEKMYCLECAEKVWDKGEWGDGDKVYVGGNKTQDDDVSTETEVIDDGVYKGTEMVSVSVSKKVLEDPDINVSALIEDELRDKGLLKKEEDDEGEKTVEKSPPCRLEGETKEDCVDRKVPEIMEEDDVDQEQAVAMAHSMCERECEEEGKAVSKADNQKNLNSLVEEVKDFVEKEGRVLSDSNRSAIQNAVQILNEVLDKSSRSESEEDKKLSTDLKKIEVTIPVAKTEDGKRVASVRKINKVIRKLLEEKNKLKSQ